MWVASVSDCSTCCSILLIQDYPDKIILDSIFLTKPKILHTKLTINPQSAKIYPQFNAVKKEKVYDHNFSINVTFFLWGGKNTCTESLIMSCISVVIKYLTTLNFDSDGRGGNACLTGELHVLPRTPSAAALVYSTQILVCLLCVLSFSKIKHIWNTCLVLQFKNWYKNEIK